MTTPANPLTLDSQRPPTTDSATQDHCLARGPLIVWASLQLATLCLGAGRVALTARSGDAPQRFALPEMIVVQLAIASMGFPWLLAVGNRTFSIAASVVFLHAAALLTATPPRAELWTICEVTLWLVVLSANRRRAYAIGVALMSSLICGMPVVQYLALEFTDAGPAALPFWWINPIGSTVSQSSDEHLHGGALLIVLSVAVVKIFSARIIDRRAERNSRSA